jgi:acyl-CoA synthetase (AMP-forming)/AMP-acid ligase II
MLFNDFQTLGRFSTSNSPDWIEADEIRQRILKRSSDFQGKIGPGDKVMICHGGSADFLVDLLSVWNVGAAAACINPSTTENERQILCDFMEPTLSLLAAGEQPIVHRNSIASEGAAPALDDPALYLFTSGTTGNPKGVEHSFRSLLARLTLNQIYMNRLDFQRTLCPLPTHFGHGLIGNLLTPLFAGADVMLLDDKSPMGLAKLGSLIDQHEITFLSSVPSFWKLATRLSKPPTKKTLKRVHVGSAPLSTDVWEGIADWCGTENVFNMYGITETANWIGGTSLKDGRKLDGRIGSVWGGSAMIRDPETGACSSEGTGEILIQSPSLMNGYYKQSELTNAVLKNGWFHTGDMGVIETDGEIRITGRQKSEINRAGMKILPEEIDLLLERHELVQEVCVFGLPDPISGERVAAACVLKEGANLTPEDLEIWMESLIRKDAIPETWFFLDEIPKTDRGKINRNNVRLKCEELGV